MDNPTGLAILAATTLLALRKQGWAVERIDRTCLVVESRQGPTVNAMELSNDLLFLCVTDKIHHFEMEVARPPFHVIVRVS